MSQQLDNMHHLHALLEGCSVNQHKEPSVRVNHCEAPGEPPRPALGATGGIGANSELSGTITRGLLPSWGHTEIISALIHLQVTCSLSYSADKAP